MVLWNRQKKQYDWVIFSLILLFLGLFIGLNLIFYPEIIPQTLIIRATAILAILMLNVILAIGPLARLNPRFLPLLYNRRHLGVSMFLVSAVHGLFSILWFHGSGDVNPIYSLFTANMRYGSLVDFPFQTLGFFALVILFLMAATSHDFWLKNLSPKVWKALHMMVYVAYALVVMHVMLGAFQMETSPVLLGGISLGFMVLSALHISVGIRQNKIDQAKRSLLNDGFVEVAPVNDIAENRAKVLEVGSESIAVFKYEGKLSAISNVCKHQNGPLGEGKIIDGCITCPWHGYQYLPNNGCSPPPFEEKVATYDLRLVDGVVYVNPKGHPEGTEVEPIIIS